MVDIKNSDSNGPEGQFMEVSAAMCNAGFPPCHKVFMSSLWPVKVSMKKKEKGKLEDGEGSWVYIPDPVVRARTLEIFDFRARTLPRSVHAQRAHSFQWVAL